MLPKRLKLYQAYNIEFGARADAYAKDLLFASTGINANPFGSASCSSSSNALDTIFSFAELGLMAAVSGKNARNEANAQQATKTSTAINLYVSKKQEVSNIDNKLTTAKEELQALLDKKEEAGADGAKATAKINDINSQIAQLNKDNGVADSSGNDIDGSIVQKYNQAQAKLDKLTKGQSKIKQLDSNINTKESEMNSAKTSYDSAQSATYQTGGLKPVTIKFDADGNPTASLNENNYKTQKNKETGELEVDTARMQADQANINKMKSDISTAKTRYLKAQTELNQAKADKQTALSGLGVSDGQTIEQAITEATAEVNKYSTQNTTGSSGKSVVAYNSELKSLQAQKEDWQDKLDSVTPKDGGKSQVDKEIDAKKKEISDLKTKKQKAEKELEQMTKELQGSQLVSSTKALTESVNKVDKEKKDYVASKSQVGANQKSRTFFQKLFGTNKSATQKKEYDEYKAAKKERRTAAAAFTQATGLSSSDAIKMYEDLKKQGLI